MSPQTKDPVKEKPKDR